MPYKFQPGKMYMMPTHFGPMCGPRQGPGGKKFVFNPDKRKSTTVTVSFLTKANQLQKFLPPGFELAGEPVVTVFEKFMKEIDWSRGETTISTAQYSVQPFTLTSSAPLWPYQNVLA